MAYGQISLMRAVNQNVGVTKSKNNELKAVINGQPLFSWRNNGPNNNGCKWNLPNVQYFRESYFLKK